VQTLLQLIAVKQAKELDKAEALNVLYSVADSGRKYKEHICECYGSTQQCCRCLLLLLEHRHYCYQGSYRSRKGRV